MTVDSKLLLDVAERFGTPTFVYDLDVIRRQAGELKQVVAPFPNRLLYAMKANFCPAIMRLMRELGLAIDAVSPAEIEYALQLGFDSDQILYTVNNASEADLRSATERGVMCNVGSLYELERLGDLFPGIEVCLRFNPDVVAGENSKVQTGGPLTKFGILLSDASKAVEVCRSHSLTVRGIHKHTGSGIKDLGLYSRAIENLSTIIQPDLFPDLRFVDLGGGLFVPYHEEEVGVDLHRLSEVLSVSSSKFKENYGRPIEIWLEPGKFLVAEAGSFLMRVTSKKHNGPRIIVGTDSGFSHYIRPTLYGAYQRITNLSRPDRVSEVVDIVGNICESGDLFAEQRDLPKTEPGDILCLHTAGAYGASMSSLYNLRPLPSEVISDAGEVRLSRRRLTPEELVSQLLSEEI